MNRRFPRPLPILLLALIAALLAGAPLSALAQEAAVEAESAVDAGIDAGVETRGPGDNKYRSKIKAGGHREPSAEDSGDESSESGPPPPRARQNSLADSEASETEAPTPLSSPSLRVRPAADAGTPEASDSEAPSLSSPSLRPRRNADATAPEASDSASSSRPQIQRTQRQRDLLADPSDASSPNLSPTPSLAVPSAPPSSGAAAAQRARASRDLGVRSQRPLFAGWQRTPVSSLPADADAAAGEVLQVGNSGKKNLGVLKKLGAGTYGDVFLVEDKQGGKAVLKRQRAWPAGSQPDQQYNARLDGFLAQGGKARQINRLRPEQVVERAADHEVKMQKTASQALRKQRPDLADIVDDAEIVGPGLIKQRFAGPNFGNLMEDLDPIDDELRDTATRLLMVKMLRGAEALEAAGIVHRDLHLGNAALDENGQVKILDFGLAKRLKDSDVKLELESGIGAGGVYGQNPPPEMQAALNNFDTRYAASHKADIFAIGRVFDWQVMNPSFGKKLAPDSPIQDLLRDMQNRDPDARPSAAEALSRLNRLQTGREAEAEQLLSDFAARRMSAALPLPDDATTTASASQ